MGKEVEMFQSRQSKLLYPKADDTELDDPRYFKNTGELKIFPMEGVIYERKMEFQT